jgi:undecaprenyl diphosphate synthase
MKFELANLPQPLPRHVAVIMDGNGRWATRNGRPRHAGHRAGVKSARAVVERCAEAGVQFLTMFAFSSENWKRPVKEVNALMRLFIEVLQRELDYLHENGIQLRFIGDRQPLPTILRKRMEDAEARTSANSRMTLILAIGFGGRWDILRAVRRMAEKVEAGQLRSKDIDESALIRHMSLAGVPDPDLLIRTGDEHRISNFLLWDLAYTEIFFSQDLWPDFSSASLFHAFEFFASRQRRFGRTTDQLEAIGD